MFIDERPESIDVALCADCILRRTRSNHLGLEGPMRIVAVGALEQPLRNPMVKWLLKRRMNIGVALIAERRLLRLEQRGLRFKLMHAVAVGATDKTLTV